MVAVVSPLPPKFIPPLRATCNGLAVAQTVPLLHRGLLAVRDVVAGGAEVHRGGAVVGEIRLGIVAVARQHRDHVAGEQEHVELVASINVRWITFPWNRYLDTSLAFGGGLSLATEVPVLERRDPDNSDAAALLHAITLPEYGDLIV